MSALYSPSAGAERLQQDHDLARTVRLEWVNGVSHRRIAHRHGIATGTIESFLSQRTSWARKLRAELEQEVAA